MSQRLENAKSLYLHGIRDGKVREAVAAYTGDRYTQHSTGVRDGAEGFIEFFEPFLERNPIRDIQIVRAIEDGPYVFVHVYQSLNNGEAQWVTTDMFDTDDNGRMIEHWDVIAPYADKSVSGHTMVDGPTEVTDLDKTDANKALVKAFIDDVLVGGNYDNLKKYVSAETYIQHNPNVPDGLEAAHSFLQGLKDQGMPIVYEDVFKVIGQGNFVVSYSKVTMGGQQLALFDIFRVENGLIVEHWDNMEEIPPEDTWANSGKF